MRRTTVVEAARTTLGPVGVYLPVSFESLPPADVQRAAARRLERAGYRTAWTNEVVGGKDAFVQLAILLGATERLAFGTGIANVWARQPQTAHAAAAMLAEAYPGRFVLGLGVGHPQQAAATGREFGSPLAMMRDYLDHMADPVQPPAPDTAFPRIIGANGPKMLALAGETADGALPAGQPPEFTAHARRALGPDKLLVVGLSLIPDADPGRAAAAARANVSAQLQSPSYAASLARLGYAERDISEVSERLVDAIVAHGAPEAVASKVSEHLAAGADHVILMPSRNSEFLPSLDRLEQLAPAVASIA